MVEAGNSRVYINDCVSRIRRVLKWACSQELVPVAVHQSLTTLAGLRTGRSEAHVPEPIGPVSDELVEATIPFMFTVIADMVRFEGTTCARPSEVCLIRPADVDRSQETWSYCPRRHKTEHHGRQRVVFIGPLGRTSFGPICFAMPRLIIFAPLRAKPRRERQFLKDLRGGHYQPARSCLFDRNDFWCANRATT